MGELQEEAASAAADSVAALTAASVRSLPEIAALKVWAILSYFVHNYSQHVGVKGKLYG